jgi:hypothetical protein
MISPFSSPVNNVSQDTVSTVFTKQYGFRLNSVPYKSIVEKTCVADVDFYTHKSGDLPLSQCALGVVVCPFGLILNW